MNNGSQSSDDALLIEKQVIIQYLQQGVFHGDEQHIPSLAPPLPQYPFVGRTRILEHIKQRLFVGETLALIGLPGIGKTTLTLAIAHDDDVLNHFKDGVLWTSLGKTPDLFDILDRWLSALGVPEPLILAQKTLEQRMRFTRQVIGNRHMLLIIDDSWNTADSNSLKIGGIHCVYLLTTRKPQIALDFAESGNIDITKLTQNDSLTLLTAVAENIESEENDDARELVRVVDCLPLALILVGKYLRNTSPCEQPERIRVLIDQVRNRMNLSQYKDFRKQAPDIPGASISLQAVIQTTYEALIPLAKKTLQTLAVFAAEPVTFSMDAALAVTETPASGLQQLFEYGILMSGEFDRWQIHQTISDYAALQLQTFPEEEQKALSRHGHYFAKYLKEREKPLKYDISKDLIETIQTDITNIRLMWQRAVVQQQHDIIQQASDGLEKFYWVRGWYQEGKKVFGQALNTFDQQTERTSEKDYFLLLARLALFQGIFLQAFDQHAPARLLYGRSLLIRKNLLEKEHLDVAAPLNGLASLVCCSGELS